MQGPGIAVATVLSSMNGARLASLIGDRVLATLTYLNNGPPSDDHLRNVALSLYAQDAEASVRDTRIREQLVSALSIGKAQELLRSLELPVSGDVYARLRCFEFGRQRLRDEALLSFFGVVPNPTAPLTMKPSSSELAPEYGLFDYQRDVVRRASAALSQHPHKTQFDSHD